MKKIETLVRKWLCFLSSNSRKVKFALLLYTFEVRKFVSDMGSFRNKYECYSSHKFAFLLFINAFLFCSL